MASRIDYDKYLKEMGYSEDEVLQILDKNQMKPSDYMRIGELVASLMQREENTKWALNILESLNSNTNHLLKNIIDRRIQKRLAEQGKTIPVEVFPGVFPTNDFNARTVRSCSGLILVDTACFELVGAFVYISMWDVSYEERAVSIASIATKLFDERELPLRSELEHKTLAPDYPGAAGRKSWITDIMTAAEEFILAHEYGHLCLHNGESESVSGKDPSLRFKQEYEADQWAIDLLLQPTSMWGKGDQSIKLGFETELAGIAVALGIAHFMEVYSDLPSDGSYPTAYDRIVNFISIVKQKRIGQHLGWSLSLFDLSSAVALYIGLGESGFHPPRTKAEAERMRKLIINI